MCTYLKHSILHIVGIVVDQNQALRFAIDIARGMEFLHTIEPAIPNLILTSKHVMVSHSFTMPDYQVDLY